MRLIRLGPTTVILLAAAVAPIVWKHAKPAIKKVGKTLRDLGDTIVTSAEEMHDDPPVAEEADDSTGPVESASSDAPAEAESSDPAAPAETSAEETAEPKPAPRPRRPAAQRKPAAPSKPSSRRAKPASGEGSPTPQSRRRPPKDFPSG